MKKILVVFLLLMLLPLLYGAVEYTGGKLADRIITVDYAHHEIHEGNNYVAFHNAPLGASGKYQLLINAPEASTGKIVHILIRTRGSAESNIVFTEAPTVSALGAAHLVVNRNRQSSNTALTAVTLGPTITGIGTILLESHFGSGPQVGGEGSFTNEFNLAPGTLYMVNATSEGASNDLSVVLEFYEDLGDAP